jgi:hypothetical protein
VRGVVTHEQAGTQEERQLAPIAVDEGTDPALLLVDEAGVPIRIRGQVGEPAQHGVRADREHKVGGGLGGPVFPDNGDLPVLDEQVLAGHGQTLGMLTSTRLDGVVPPLDHLPLSAVHTVPS